MMAPLGTRLTRSIRIALAATAVAISAVPASIRAEITTATREELRGLLKSGEHTALDARLAELQQGFEDGRVTERSMLGAFATFAYLDPAIEKRLTEWVARMPDSAMARAARGCFYQNLAGVVRGDSSPVQTAKAQMDAMKGFLDRATPDLYDAISTRRRLIPAYICLLEATRLKLARSEAVRVAQSGLSVHPTSPALHEAFLMMTQPKNGGYLLALHQYLDGLKRRFPEARELQPLQGFNELTLGDRAMTSLDYREGLAAFSRALSFGEHWLYFHHRGISYAAQRMDEDALSDFSLALQFAPDTRSIHQEIARIKLRQSQADEAIAHLNEAIGLAGLAPRLLTDRAGAMIAANRHQDAERDLDDALIFGHPMAVVHFDRARLLLAAGQAGKAELAAKEATDLRPAEPSYWLIYTEALTAQRNCKAKLTYTMWRHACIRAAACDGEIGKTFIDELEVMQCPPMPQSQLPIIPPLLMVR